LTKVNLVVAATAGLISEVASGRRWWGRT